MTDDFLAIKIDIGEVLKKIEQAKRTGSDQVMFFASFNENKSENDNQPLYKSANVAVWKNKKNKAEND